MGRPKHHCMSKHRSVFELETAWKLVLPEAACLGRPLLYMRFEVSSTSMFECAQTHEADSKYDRTFEKPKHWGVRLRVPCCLAAAYGCRAETAIEGAFPGEAKRQEIPLILPQTIPIICVVPLLLSKVNRSQGCSDRLLRCLLWKDMKGSSFRRQLLSKSESFFPAQ